MLRSEDGTNLGSRSFWRVLGTICIKDRDKLAPSGLPISDTMPKPAPSKKDSGHLSEAEKVPAAPVSPWSLESVKSLLEIDNTSPEYYKSLAAAIYPDSPNSYFKDLRSSIVIDLFADWLRWFKKQNASHSKVSVFLQLAHILLRQLHATAEETGSNPFVSLEWVTDPILCEVHSELDGASQETPVDLDQMWAMFSQLIQSKIHSPAEWQQYETIKSEAARAEKELRSILGVEGGDAIDMSRRKKWPAEAIELDERRTQCAEQIEKLEALVCKERPLSVADLKGITALLMDSFFRRFSLVTYVFAERQEVDMTSFHEPWQVPIVQPPPLSKSLPEAEWNARIEAARKAEEDAIEAEKKRKEEEERLAAEKAEAERKAAELEAQRIRTEQEVMDKLGFGGKGAEVLTPEVKDMLVELYTGGQQRREAIEQKMAEVQEQLVALTMETPAAGAQTGRSDKSK